MELAINNDLDNFLEYSGYSTDDVLVFNPATGEVVTINGGRYCVTDTGKFLHLGGPSPDPTDRV